jgi:hypothetical protein
MLNTKIVQASAASPSGWIVTAAAPSARSSASSAVTAAQQPQSFSFPKPPIITAAAPAQAHPQPAQAAQAPVGLIDELKQALAEKQLENRGLEYELTHSQRVTNSLIIREKEKNQTIEAYQARLAQAEIVRTHAQTLAQYQAHIAAQTMAAQQAEIQRLKESPRCAQALLEKENEELKLKLRILEKDQDKKDEDIRVLNIQLRQEQDLRKQSDNRRERSDAALAVQLTRAQKLEDELVQQREQARRK